MSQEKQDAIIDYQDVIGDDEIEAKRLVDVMFILDASGSMHDDIEAVRSNIGKFMETLGNLEGDNLDWQIGFVAENTSFEWPWLDLTPDLNQFRQKLEPVKAQPRDECTPHAMDYVIEHASWREGAKCFMAVFTDEPAETGYSCEREQFKALCDKIAGKGMGLLFVATDRCLNDRIYEMLEDLPRTFVSRRLHEDRGEKLMEWMAHSVSKSRNIRYASAETYDQDIFNIFDRVQRV